MLCMVLWILLKLVEALNLGLGLPMVGHRPLVRVNFLFCHIVIVFLMSYLFRNAIDMGCAIIR